MEESKRASKRAMATAAGVLFGPLYIVSLFFIVDRAFLRAIGTFSFLMGAGAVVGFVIALITRAPLPRAFAITLASFAATTGAFYALDLETGLCLVVLLLPLIAFSALTVIGLGASNLARIRRTLAKIKGLTLLILLAPLGGAIVENHYLAVTTTRTVEASVLVRADPATVWQGIVEVAPFTERELPATWLQHLGVPRPVYATLQRENGTAMRVGHFEDGLVFRESIETFLPERELGLFIESVDYDANPRGVVAHAFSQGFTQIGDVRYRLTPQGESVVLTLSCTYSVHTTVTPYAELVGDLVIGTFQAELLRALAARLEHRAPIGGARLVAERD